MKIFAASLLTLCITANASVATNGPVTLGRDGHWLVIAKPGTPGEIRVNYLEAYCRGGSTDADWVQHTVIRHTSIVVSATATNIQLLDTLADGVIVEHAITAKDDEVDFRLVAHNPTDRTSEVQWAQPCVRLSRFLNLDEKTAINTEDYLPQCFIFLGGKLVRMPTQPWAKEARYTPGQTWCPAHVPRTDVNPRPLSSLVPDNGLIGCFSSDDRWIFATAWEPYQELFQGIARCIHSDLRIAGLKPGERKEVRGKIYLVPNDPTELLRRYRSDFPEHDRR